MTRHQLGLFLLASVALAACVVQSDRSHEWIRKKASQDFSCPMGQITVYHYTDKPHEKGVVGCGREAVYRERCQGSQCVWELDPNAPPPKRPK